MDDALQFTATGQIVAGLLLLFLGRRLFWLFVGVVGFFAGVQFGDRIFAGMENWMLLLLSIGLGVIAAVLALALQRLAVMVAGGLMGGILAMQIAPSLGFHADNGLWVAFLFGALLAAVLFSVLFDPMLIGISALAGAVMITGALNLGDLLQAIMTIALFVAGVLVQMRIARHRPAVGASDGRL